MEVARPARLLWFVDIKRRSVFELPPWTHSMNRRDHAGTTIVSVPIAAKKKVHGQYGNTTDDPRLV
jgi:hypothetical protein